MTEDERPEPLTIADIAAKEGLPEDVLREALRQAHPDASPSEVIMAAHDLLDEQKSGPAHA